MYINHLLGKYFQPEETLQTLLRTITKQNALSVCSFKYHHHLNPSFMVLTFFLYNTADEMSLVSVYADCYLTMMLIQNP